MKLKTKILIWLGILLILMVILLYIVPAYFVKKDVNVAAGQIRTIIEEDQKELLKSQQIWTENALEKAKENLNALLFMLYERKKVLTDLIFTDENSTSKVWDALVSIAGFDPDIGFVQTHSTVKNQSAAIATASSQLYPAQSLKQEKDIILFDLQTSQKTVENYIGIPLPSSLQVDPGHTYYAFASVKNIPKELLEIHEEIEQEIKSLETKKNSSAGEPEAMKEFSFPLSSSSPQGYSWALKMHMIRLLTPLFIRGLSITSISELMTPEGLLRVDQSLQGFAILSEDIYRKTPSFDDKRFFEEHPPQFGIPISSDSAVFVDHDTTPLIGQILHMDSTFLTLGFSLENIVKELALASHTVILMQVNNHFWFGFDGNGNKLPNENLRNLQVNQEKKGASTVVIGQESYYITPFNDLLGNAVKLYQLHPVSGQKTILGTLEKLEKSFSRTISWQLFLLTLGIVILVFGFIGRLGFHVIQPIMKLADATDDVVKGNYDEINLPYMEESHDEIAILTRSFSDMVKGLQEREKIRAVLDKVVSKDVADEILRTQIHLGGEDRPVTMLFSDIRDFSDLTENMSPQETIHILNGCMTKISRVIEGEGGVIDKYVGDEVMALFGAPTKTPDHALRAISAGILILETLKKWNIGRLQSGHPVIEMGIGIHTGVVVAGNMGAEDRLNYTVLGANVNLAARLCESAKRNQLIISESTLKEPKVEESFYVKALSPISLKGFSEPVQIYEVLGFKWEES